jgi:hypothetical protein
VELGFREVASSPAGHRLWRMAAPPFHSPAFQNPLIPAKAGIQIKSTDV